ncbi:hypothetical protein GGF46_004146, partial [Coemansia sp. RSA 552]
MPKGGLKRRLEDDFDGLSIEVPCTEEPTQTFKQVTFADIEDDDLSLSDAEPTAAEDSQSPATKPKRAAKGRAKPAARRAGAEKARQEANHTMYALVSRSEQDLTQRSLGRVGTQPSNGERERLYNVYWPTTALRQYLSSAQMDVLKPLGIDPLRYREPQYVDMALEEPGMERDARELAVLAGGAADGFDSSVGYTGPPLLVADGVDIIADMEVNGGLGLVVKRHADADTSPTSMAPGGTEILTRQQILHPELRAPRYSRVPLPQEFEDGQPPVALAHFQPLIDMTRAQVLAQIQKTRQPAPNSQLPLSSFVSCTVAEEAVSGVARAWEKTEEVVRSVAELRGTDRLD